MSQFLNQVQRAQTRETSDLTDIDMSQVANSLAEARQPRPEPPSNGNRESMAGLLDGLLDSNSAGAQLGESRLQNCRKFEIPHVSSKLMFPDSEIANTSVGEAYKGVRTRLLRAQATMGIRTMCISSAVPSEGKTLTSANIGLCCAQQRPMLAEVKVLPSLGTALLMHMVRIPMVAWARKSLVRTPL